LCIEHMFDMMECPTAESAWASEQSHLFSIRRGEKRAISISSQVGSPSCSVFPGPG